MCLFKPLIHYGYYRCRGTFTWGLTKSNRAKLGWKIGPRFSICLHKRDYDLLRSIKSFFGGIGVLKVTGDFAYYDINSIRDLRILFAHLDLFPLLTFKRNMYHIFVTVYWLYVDKVHLTPQGFKLCLAYINLLNRPIKAGTIRAIVALHGSLPTIILPPVLITTQYLLNPY